jgi:hypothetical protein
MHLMKTRFSAAQFLALSLAVVAPLSAQPTPPGVPMEGPPPPGMPIRTMRAPGQPMPSGAGSREMIEARTNLMRLKADLGEDDPHVMAERGRVEMLEGLEPKKISIDFRGGPLSALLNQIGGPDGPSLSIIGADGLNPSEVGLPPFSLRNAHLVTLIEVVRQLVPREFQFEPAGPIEPNTAVCVLRRRVFDQPRTNAGDFESFQLAPLLKEQSVDDIIGAIRTAWELDPRHDKEALRIKFHPPTGLLLISGQSDGSRRPSEAIEIAHKVISQLKRPPGTPPGSPPPLEAPGTARIIEKK